MFRKPFHVKSNALAKGSEVKRLRRHIATSLLAVVEHVGEAAIRDRLLPAKASMAVVRLALHSGEAATVYAVDGEPLFFENQDGVLCPSVYALWRVHEMVPCLTTWPAVLDKLKAGADLMLPGVVCADKGGCPVSAVQKQKPCAINIFGNRSAVAVGVALVSAGEMAAGGMKGRGVRVLHCHGDRLWAFGSRLEVPLVPVVEAVISKSSALTEDFSADPCPVGTNEPSTTSARGPVEGSRTCADRTELLPLSDASERGCGDPVAAVRDSVEGTVEEALSSEVVGKLSVDGGCEAVPDHGGLPHVSGGGGGGIVASVDVGRGSPSLQADQPHTHVEEASGDGGGEDAAVSVDPVRQMDELLMECFLQALKTRLARLDLPMLSSTFYRSHMLELCPAGMRLDVKKTSHKKLSRFLRAMEAEGLVRVREVSKGVEEIESLDHKHPLVRAFSPRLLQAQQGNNSSGGHLGPGGACAPARGIGEGEGAGAKSVRVEVRELFMPPASLLPVFAASGRGRSSVLDANELRECVTAYVRENELSSPSDPRMVTLDPVLSHALVRKGGPPVARLSWKALMEAVAMEMRPAHSIARSGRPPEVRRGRLEPIEMEVVQRSGNKRVTLVHNLEAYGADPSQLAPLIQRAAAASCSVSESPRKPGSQLLLVQGSSVRLIARILQEQCGIDPKHMLAVDKVKKKSSKPKR